MRILVIEDDRQMVNTLKRGLTELGYAVDAAYTGEEGCELAKAVTYDLIILDIMLPGMDGIAVCLELRNSDIRSRIIMLTGRDAVTDRIKGLDSGADDYMVKPFDFGELRARIGALLRRELDNASNIIQAGNLSIDTLSRRVKRGECSVSLPIKEYAILEYFMRNPDIVLTRSMIEDHIWDYSFESNSNIVDVYIARLRKKIDIEGQPGYIETVRNVGYRFNVKEQE